MCSAVADKRGLKRVCTECGIRFYDFNKRPIACPNCEKEFTGAEKIKARRGRMPVEKEVPVASKVPNNDDEIEIDAEAGVISLDELESAETELDDDELDADLALDDDDIDDLGIEGDADDEIEEEPEEDKD